MKNNPTKTRILDYVLQHEAERGSYPSAKSVSEALELGISIVQYYLKLLRDDGVIEDWERKSRPGEDAVYNYITEFEQAHGTYPSVQVITASLNRDRITVQRHIAEMIRSGRLENKGNFYPTPQIRYKESSRSRGEEEKKSSGIWMSEVRKAKDKIKEGDTVLIKDDRFWDAETGTTGRIVRAEVIFKSERVMCLSHRLSCTYAQLAKWYRDRRVAIQ